MRTTADIDPHNPNMIAGTDWGKVPIPQSYTDLYAHYGNPSHPDFEDRYLISLPHNLSDGRQVHVISHIAMVPALHDVFATCGQFIHTYDGCYNYRPVRGGTHLSLHSWGLAIDLNAAQNPLGSTDRTKQAPELVACFKKHGFWWGADYHHRTDPMHFQRAGDF